MSHHSQGSGHKELPGNEKRSISRERYSKEYRIWSVLVSELLAFGPCFGQSLITVWERLSLLLGSLRSLSWLCSSPNILRRAGLHVLCSPVKPAKTEAGGSQQRAKYGGSRSKGARYTPRAVLLCKGWQELGHLWRAVSLLQGCCLVSRPSSLQ